MSRGLTAPSGAASLKHRRWKAHDEDAISVALGAIAGPTGVTLGKHIFTATKGDYYTIADPLPQVP